MGWKRVLLAADIEQSMVAGRAGTVPAALANDVADFLVVVPFNITLFRLKATMLTAPAVPTTIQIRRSTNSGASFADAFGIVTIAAAAKVGTSAPSQLAVNEGDIMNISIAAGGGSGTNLAVFMIGRSIV